MSSFTLLAAGTQATSGAGAAVDVSEAAKLTVDATFRCDNQQYGGTLHFFLESAPTATGPWETIQELRMRLGAGGNPDSDPYAWRNAQHVILSAFDSFLRVRWEASRSDMVLNIGATAEGVP